MYLDDAASEIRAHVPVERLPDGNADELFRLYAMLARAKGTTVTESDVHDAWCAWKSAEEPDHESLIPYRDLPEDVKRQDFVFATAVRRFAEETGIGEGLQGGFAQVLFPSGPPKDEAGLQQTLALYKIMVDSSESLVNRRQGVNTFFLTINGALLTASGIIVQSSGADRLTSWGILVLAVAGVILCWAWMSLINSFGQLNRGKFRVINAIERHLQAAIYAAEWEALGRGADPQIYRSFTSREIWVPKALCALHALTVVVALFAALGKVGANAAPSNTPELENATNKEDTVQQADAAGAKAPDIRPPVHSNDSR